MTTHLCHPLLELLGAILSLPKRQVLLNCNSICKRVCLRFTVCRLLFIGNNLVPYRSFARRLASVGAKTGSLIESSTPVFAPTLVSRRAKDLYIHAKSCDQSTVFGFPRHFLCSRLQTMQLLIFPAHHSGDGTALMLTSLLSMTCQSEHINPLYFREYEVHMWLKHSSQQQQPRSARATASWCNMHIPRNFPRQTNSSDGNSPGWKKSSTEIIYTQSAGSIP